MEKNKRKKILKALFITLLLVLAASPLSTLGHEIWHMIFSYFYGGQPISLCIDFNQRSFASVQVETPPMWIETRCYIHFYDELIAHLVGVGVLFLMMYIFTKKYQDLIETGSFKGLGKIYYLTKEIAELWKSKKMKKTWLNFKLKVPYVIGVSGEYAYFIRVKNPRLVQFSDVPDFYNKCVNPKKRIYEYDAKLEKIERRLRWKSK